jgi:hypothetical protein
MIIKSLNLFRMRNKLASALIVYIPLGNKCPGPLSVVRPDSRALPLTTATENIR